MVELIERDYRKMRGMIFDAPPAFAEVIGSIKAIHAAINQI